MATAKKAVKKAAKKAPAKKPAKAASKKAPKNLVGGFAVIMTGGKQYLVRTGDIITIEKLSDTMSVGDAVTFDQVLLVDDGSTTVIGKPFIAGSAVAGELVEIGRSAKIDVIQYKQKSRYYKKKGHRQPFMKVKIGAIK